jgi:hypothetical protein
MSALDPSLAAAGVAPSLDAIVALAHQVVPASVAVSVTVIGEAGAITAASTGRWAADLDRAQYDADAGPCVDAAIGGETRSIADIRHDDRWPTYAVAALAAGALSSVSIPIPVDDGLVASLNAYATHVDAFSSADRARLRKLAAVAAAVLSSGAATPLRSRPVMDQAKGILMHEEHCSAELAMDGLAKRALDSGRSLQQVAADVVAATGR